MRRVLTMASAAILAAAAGQAQAKPITLKFAVFTPEQELTFQRVMKPFAASVTKDSKGTLAFKMYPNGALGRHPARQLKMVQDGVADIAWVIPAYTPGRFPDNSVFELPNVIKNSREGSIAAWRMLRKGLLKGYGDFYMIGLFVTAPYSIHTKNKVTSMNGLKGLKIRAVGPAMVASIKALGAAPEPMPFTKIVEAVSRGVIDGTTGHPIAIYDFGVSKVTTSHYFGLLGTVNLGLFMNKKKYDALPAAGRAALDKHRGEAQSIAFGVMSDSRNAELQAQWSKDPKRTVTVQSKAEEARWDKALAPVVAAWVKKHPKGKLLLGSLKAELAAIRAGK